MMKWFVFALTLLTAGAAYAQSCPVLQSSPGFGSAGGNVFGKIAPQWDSYFAAKVDANKGVLCNPTIIGTLAIPPESVIGALGFTPAARDGGNLALPDMLNALGIGPGAAFIPKTSTPFNVITTEPAANKFGLSTLFYAQNYTGTTPVSTAAMYGMVINARQDVQSTLTGTFSAPYYIGGAFTSTMRAAGGEGGFATTLSAPAISGATTLTLTSTTGFVTGLVFDIVLDNGLVQHVTQVGAPAGSIITITPALNSAAASGNAVYRWFGGGTGLQSQGTFATGVTGMNAQSAEFSISAQTGSQPYIKSILGLTANFDDAVRAVSPYDSGLYLSAQTGAVGTKVGISFDDRAGKQLVSTTGTLIKAFGGAYKDGFVADDATFTGDPIRVRGLTVSGAAPGSITLTGSGSPPPQLYMRDTAATVTAGGLWRQTVTSGQLFFQNNTAAGGDFSTSISLLSLDQTGYALLSASSTNLRFRDTATAVTAGGLWREIASGGNLTFQVNTAAGGDFSAVNSNLVLTQQGDVFLTGGAAALATNVTAKFAFLSTMAGAPSGTPTNALAGRTAVVWDSTNKKLCSYNQPTTAWTCSAAFTP